MNATKKALAEREEIKRRLVRIHARMQELKRRNAPASMLERLKVDRAWCIEGMRVLNLELADYDEMERMKENGIQVGSR